MFVPPACEVSIQHLPALVPQPLSAHAYAQALSLLAMTGSTMQAFIYAQF